MHSTSMSFVYIQIIQKIYFSIYLLFKSKIGRVFEIWEVLDEDMKRNINDDKKDFVVYDVSLWRHTKYDMLHAIEDLIIYWAI